MSSIDSLAGVPAGRRAAIGPETWRRVAVACFGLATAAGLVFAFVGLDLHSFWFDELFTARLLAPAEGTTLLGRIATDVHPPLYLMALSLFTQPFGASDAVLRGFSALAAVGAIVVFVAGTRGAFSLPARLFAAALATGSLFWFFQAQNVRSYALCLLIAAGVLSVALALVQGRGRRRVLLAALIGLMLAGSFVHFYMMYLGLAVLGVLFLLDRRDRILMVGAAVGLVAAVGLYMKLVVEPHVQVSLTSYWQRNDFDWYIAVLQSCLRCTFDREGVAALALCSAAFLYTRRATAWPGLDRVTVLSLGVPLIVVAGGIASSILLAPNFSDRNVLVASPFLWALAARVYDAAIDRASPLLRLALTAVLAFIVLSMTSIASSRLPAGETPSIYEPYRQSAAWIQTLPACHGQTLPLITVDNPDWYKPGYAAWIHEGGSARYLNGFAEPRLVFSRDLDRERLPADLIRELQQRLDGAGCPVLAWAIHNVSPPVIAAIEDRLLGAIDRRPAAARILTRRFDDGSPGYVLTVAR